MATTTWTCNKDARVALNGATNLGAGASDFLPVGLYSGYLYRSLLGFNYSFAGMVSITSAVLNIKTSSQYYVAFGSDPDIEIRRITSSWSEGTASSMTAGNAVVYPGPNTVSTNMVTADITTAENTWEAITITSLVQDAFANNVFYGLNIRAADEATASDVTEFYAREYGSNDAYITVTYSTNTVPNAPTVNSPTASELISSTTPTISITHSDPQGDAASSFDIQIDATTAAGVEPDWASMVWSTTNDTSDLINPITKVVGSALTRGTWYALRARTADTLGDGAWSATRFFKVASLPTATVTTPTAGHTAKVYYTAGTNTTPKLTVAWTFSDANGHAQTGASIKVYADSAGVPGALLHTHAHTGSATTANLTGYAPTNGTKYHISVTPTCSMLTGNESTKNITRVRWGRASYFYDMVTPPTNFGVPTFSASVPTNTALTVEYATTASTVEPSTWYSTLAAAGTPARYVWHRTTMMAWGSAAPTSPTLNDITFTYNSNVISPDNWTLGAGVTIDASTFVYGTQSLKLTGNGAALNASQVVTGLIPGLVYSVSGRIKSVGNSGSRIMVMDVAGLITYGLAPSPPVAATQEFGQLDANGNDISRVSATFTAVSESVRVYCYMAGAVGTFAWFDALKIEQSSVVTPWTPGFVGGGVSVDAGGIQVDALSGGVFRLRGSAGTITELDGDSLSMSGAGGLPLALDIKTTGDVDGSRLAFRTDGSIQFGDGVSADTYLYRNGPGELEMSGALVVDGTMFLGVGKDVALYRHAANILRTDDTFYVGNPASTTGISLTTAGAIEMVAATNPYIDFKNAAVDDYDARIIYNLAASGIMEYYGPTFKFNSTINVVGAVWIDGTQVVSNRIAGWGTNTGTIARTGFDTAGVTTAGVAQRLAALLADLKTHGLIGA